MMKNNHDKIDKTLKEVISKFEKSPPESVWKGISKKMFYIDLKSFNIHNYQARLYALALLLFFLANSVLYFTIFNNKGNIKNIAKKELTVNPVIKENKSGYYEKQNNNESTPDILKTNPNYKSVNIKDSKVTNETGQDEQITNIKKNKGNLYPPDHSDKKRVVLDQIVNKNKLKVDSGYIGLDHHSEKNIATDLKKTPIPLNILDTITLSVCNSKLSNVTLESGNREPQFFKVDFFDFQKSRHFFLSLSHTSEKMYNVSNSYVHNRFNTFEMNAGYKFSDYFVQTGAGISFVQSVGDYQIDYSKFDVIGSYINLDSIDAIVYVDTILNQTVIDLVYYTHNEDIYDSIYDNLKQSTNNRYTYLNIPLLFGYKRDLKKWSIFLKGGPLVSFLIYQKEPDVIIVDNKIVISKVSNKSPTHLETNWQVLVSIGCAYRITDKLLIAAEPTWKYYQSNKYKIPESSGKPNSFGIKTGLIWNF